MAAPGRQFTEYVFTGSDEVFSLCSDELLYLYCDPCDADSRQTEAAGFCTNCEEYLCRSCLDFHRRVTLTKTHDIMDESHMPRVKPFRKTRESDGDKCDTHPSKCIEYFCEKHDYLGCTACITTEHRSCDFVTFIPDIASGLEDSQEYENLIAKYKYMNHCVDENKRISKENIAEIEKDEAETIGRIRKFRKEINDFFNNLENNAKEEVTLVKHKEVQRMNALSDVCESVSSELQAVAIDVENKRTTALKVPLFVAMKRAKLQTDSFEMRIDMLSKENSIPRYTFEPAASIKAAMKSVNTFGELPTMKATTNHVKDIKVGSAFARKDCNITGLVVLSSGRRLVAVDQEHNSVKLVDVTKNKIMHEQSFKFAPWGITSILYDQVAVTVPSEGEIHFLDVSDILTKRRSVSVPGKCYGIVYSYDTLIVTFADPAMVTVMDTSGTVLRNITPKGPEIYKKPFYIALSPEHRTIYISDEKGNAVTSLNHSGRVMNVYRDERYNFFSGLAIDKYGYVYVCVSYDSTIYQLSPDCTKEQIILGQKDELVSPKSVSYSEEDDMLYVGMRDKNIVKAFKLIRPSASLYPSASRDTLCIVSD